MEMSRSTAAPLCVRLSHLPRIFVERDRAERAQLNGAQRNPSLADVVSFERCASSQYMPDCGIYGFNAQQSFASIPESVSPDPTSRYRSKTGRGA